MRKSLFILTLLFGALPLRAQSDLTIAKSAISDPQPADEGLAGLHQALLDATTGFTLMSVASHPDDEDIESITYYRRKYGIRTVVVVSNRGEGGQNEIGPELYTDLAVVRSHEMAAAEKISGGEYYNLNFVDFGYSKDVQETYDHWGKPQLTERLVRAIRALRPQVIITNHDESRGHSNHQAVGRAVREAFRLAGDSTAFPEQLRQGLQPWQPLRLFQRAFGKLAKADVEYNTGEFDPFLGMSYALLAARAMSQHRSQGFDKFARNILPGPRSIRYQLVSETGPDDHMLQGDNLFSDLSEPLAALQALPGKTAVDLSNAWQQLLRLSRTSREVLDESKIALAALQGKSVAEKLLAQLTRERILLDRFAQACNRLAAKALGVQLAVRVLDTRVTPGDTLRSDILVWNTGDEQVQILDVALTVPGTRQTGSPVGTEVHRSGATLDSYKASTLLPGQQAAIPIQIVIPENVAYTEPESLYVYQSMRPQPSSVAKTRVRWQGYEFVVEQPVPIAVAPRLLLEPQPAARIVPIGRRDSVDIPILVRNLHQDTLQGVVRLRDESGNTLEKSSFFLPREETYTAVHFRIPAPKNRPRRMIVEATPSTTKNALASAEIYLKPVEVQITGGVRVGVVQSYDPTLVDALGQMDIAASTLDNQDLLFGNLDDLDVILIDIRAYLVREDLRAANDRLLAWVHGGGRLVVMYHKTLEWNPEHGNPAFAPYPLHLSSNRVTDENATVQVLDPTHPLLNAPNKITDTDWQGWVQERGLYFPDKLAAEYIRLLAMHDPGEQPLDTSLLVASYGAGQYIYTSLVWYRELRALVTGAYRMLANMVSWQNQLQVGK